MKYPIEQLTIAGALAVQTDPDHTSTCCGHPYPSIEYFVDNYFENTVGFCASYHDQKVIDGWLTGIVDECADTIGPENALYLVALCDALNAGTTALYEQAKEKYGEHEVFDHDSEFELLNDENIEDLCDMVRAHIGA